MFELKTRTRFSDPTNNLNLEEAHGVWHSGRLVREIQVGKANKALSVSFVGATSLLALAFTCAIFLSGCGALVTQSSSSQPGGALSSFNVSPDSIDFGTVNVGQSGNSRVYLINSSVDPITVSQLTLSNAAFKADGYNKLPVTAPANSTTTVNVHFVPNADGDVSGNLTVVSSLQTPASGSR